MSFLTFLAQTHNYMGSRSTGKGQLSYDIIDYVALKNKKYLFRPPYPAHRGQGSGQHFHKYIEN